ncbi:MAG: SDR family NAD(P)-dependent oxidoreductase [Bacteriovoracia bacterium]
MLLQGKNILVTGGSKGLGRAFCLEFKRQGANVFFTYLSDEAGAQETQRQMGCGEYFRADALKRSDMETLKKNLDEKNVTIDILVNNAGVSQAMPFPLQDEQDWDRVVYGNTKSLFHVTQVFLPPMIRRKKGVVLNIGSLAGEKMLAAPVHYATSKAALHGFTATLAKEVGRYGVRVLNLAPGLLKEGVARNLPDNMVKDYENHVALRRVGEFDEVAKFAAFMISEKNSYMTGSTVLMDGGF